MAVYLSSSLEPVAARMTPSLSFRYSTASATESTVTMSESADTFESSRLSLMYSAPACWQPSRMCFDTVVAYGWVASTTISYMFSEITLAIPSAPPQLPTCTSMLSSDSITSAP